MLPTDSQPIRFDPNTRGPLHGVRVLDLSRLVAGNMVSLQLGDFGADVIKVEPPSGDPLRMGPMNPDSKVERAIVPAPALYDLDDDDRLEIIISGSDGYVHVFRFDGSIQPGFPVEVVAPFLWTDPMDAQPSRIVTPPAVGDADGDGLPDIAVGSNETGSADPQGAIHLIHGLRGHSVVEVHRFDDPDPAATERAWTDWLTTAFAVRPPPTDPACHRR